jgi:cell wall-associated NlpC family hydrolase
MRWLTLTLSVLFVTVTVVSFVLLFAGSEAHSQTRATELQYATEDKTAPDTTSQEATQEIAPEETTSKEASISQGSLPGAHAPVEVIAAMDPPTDYSQVVDNASSRRFKAPSWATESLAQGHYGADYGVAKPTASTKSARFKVKVPADDYYTVYARWPADAGNSTAARFGISTVSGVEWTKVDQQRDGGFWVKLGAYRMEAGDRYAVQVSPDSGVGAYVVADAVMIVRGTQVAPLREDASMSGDSILTPAGRRVTGRDVLRVARKHIGTPYLGSPPNLCKAYGKEDCSCHTEVVFRVFGRTLPDDPSQQWRYGQRVARSNLRPGDLVFFDEDQDGTLEPWDHVGIYSGNRNMVHASNYFGKVVESQMSNINGYWGAKRLRLEGVSKPLR